MTPMQGVKPKSLDKIKTDKAERMRADKYSFAKIGVVLGVSGNTVSRALQARKTAYNKINLSGKRDG